MSRKLLTLLLILASSFTAKAYRQDTVLVHSAKMDRDIPAIVVVPDKALPPHFDKCPSIYLLHGHAGSYTFWTDIRKDLGEVADSYGFIFVCPNAENSWYFDSPIRPDSQFETFVSQELVNYIDEHYNTLADRDFRAIAGLSMGGHGAMFLGMRHTDIFCSAGSMSGCPDIRVHPGNWNIQDVLGNYADDSIRWDKHCVVNQISRIKNGELSLIIDCGEQDFMLEMNKDLHTRLLGAGIDHDFITRPGYHWFNYWQNALDYQLLFHGKVFKANSDKHNSRASAS